MSTAAKRQIGIEQLLQWTYLDELPKRQISSAEGIWDRLAQYGSLGGVNPDPGGSGNAQRYAQFGLPHPDAETIEKAVGALGRAPFDWKNNFELVAGDLAALVTINEVQQAPRSYALPFKSHDMIVGDSGFGPRQLDGTTLEEFSYVREHHEGKLRKGLRIKPGRYAPRDVLLVNSVNLSALVTTHAVKRSRPDWRTEQMRPIPMLAERSQLAMVIGKCKAKN
ncbi:MAG: hypothetical protein KGL35_06045, partial [Bradyrhizobium sp.]|nr:hypothetical protein [Bradyrhizobium sp.]